MSYNGWTNWETWITHMHMFDGLTARDINGSRTVTADDVREYFNQWREDVEGPNAFVADIISGFASEVDWRELAIHLNSDELDEDEDDEA